MGHYIIKKGLNLPITGEPAPRLDAAPPVSRVAVLAADYIGMKPTMLVQQGSPVKRGQPLFEDKKQPGVLHTAPGAGTVLAVNRGERRALQSVVIELTETERRNQPEVGDFHPFAAYTGKDPALLDRAQVKALLVESGLWTALRTRPFSRTPAIDSVPHAIFITAMDTNPLAPNLDLSVEGREDDLRLGALVAAKLTDGQVYWCTTPGSKVRPPANLGVDVETFEGPHPAGNVGTHIHLLTPVNRHKTVWHAGIQDVLTIGALFRTGRLSVERLLTLAGPGVKAPRHLKTRAGAWIDEIVRGETAEGEQRVISGSVLSGRKAMGEILGYLGRFHHQISVIAEDHDRKFLGWLSPGADTFSVVNVFVSKFLGGKKFAFTTTANGAPRAMVPIGVYERVTPLDLVMTYLLRSLIMNDIERAEMLGCLELDEEDVALSTFVCPCKFDYGPILRRNLDEIEREG
ncbi:MAG TPA: Na(+)-translocating NADH-quinone reductase subunit A [Candidatus Hydrogenedentes bacterium]|nr:Na(+)-translocating NADH-quinone reductase subunit A [Candidatus Hydrogenedentota bacterium]